MKPPGSTPRFDRASDATSFVSIQYEPIAQIGAGGMGHVMLARAVTGPAAGRCVAMKRLYPELEREPQFLDAFLDEVWLISSLHHPNIVEPLDWGRDEQGSYLAMEFVPGDSLRELLAQREATRAPLPLPIVVEIVAAVAEGLHAAHELRNDKGEPLNLVHRDVSPANVLVGFDGSVKLIDFGIAKAVGKLVQTSFGMTKGKYGYMSPEQVCAQPLDRRSDVFSLGIVAWEMLTQGKLYDPPDGVHVGELICHQDPPPPSSLRPDVPPELERVVLRCLAKDPRARYPTCAALVADLAPLRPSRQDARHQVAKLARATMPARLAWVERIMSERVPPLHTPVAPAPDRTLSEATQLVPSIPAPPAPPPPHARDRARRGPSRAELARLESNRRAVLAGALLAVAGLAMVVGVWLGSR